LLFIETVQSKYKVIRKQEVRQIRIQNDTDYKLKKVNNSEKEERECQNEQKFACK